MEFALTAVLLAGLPEYLDTLLPSKNALEANAIYYTPPSIGRLETRTRYRTNDAV